MFGSARIFADIHILHHRSPARTIQTGGEYGVYNGNRLEKNKQ